MPLRPGAHRIRARARIAPSFCCSWARNARQARLQASSAPFGLRGTPWPVTYSEGTPCRAAWPTKAKRPRALYVLETGEGSRSRGSPQAKALKIKVEVQRPGLVR